MRISSAPTLERHCSLSSLLERWSRLEPDLCRAARDKAAYALRLETLSKPFWYKLSESANENLDTAVLQSCVQNALSQRVLHWRLSYNRGLSEASVKFAGQRHSVSVPSEAMALLWAYLNALEQKQPASLKA